MRRGRNIKRESKERYRNERRDRDRERWGRKGETDWEDRDRKIERRDESERDIHTRTREGRRERERGREGRNLHTD
eukprot:1360094-Amorphochlora_amoeboformis.AAC.1